MFYFFILLAFFLVSREYILFNEEILVIVSFLLVFSLLFVSLSEMFSQSFDKIRLESRTQMGFLSSQRLLRLRQAKNSLVNADAIVQVFGTTGFYFLFRLKRKLMFGNHLRKFFWFEHYRDFLFTLKVGFLIIQTHIIGELALFLKNFLLKHRKFRKVYKKQLQFEAKSAMWGGYVVPRTKILVKIC